MITKNGHLIYKVVQNSCYKKVVNFAHSKYNHECMQHRASCVHNGKKSAATGNNNNKQENFLCKKRQLDGSLAFPIFLQQVSNRHMTDQVTDQVDERCERSWHWWWISSWLAWMTIGTTGCDCFGKGQIHGSRGGRASHELNSGSPPDIRNTNISGWIQERIFHLFGFLQFGLSFAAFALY